MPGVILLLIPAGLFLLFSLLFVLFRVWPFSWLFDGCMKILVGWNEPAAVVVFIVFCWLLMLSAVLSVLSLPALAVYGLLQL